MRAGALRRWATAACLVLLVAPEAACAKRRNRNMKNNAPSRRRDCERGNDGDGFECHMADEDDRDNCILKCQSPACYAEVYAADELEPGEIDTKRSKKFNACVTKENRERGRAGSKPPPPADEAEDEEKEET